MTVPTCQPEYSAFTHYLATNEPCLFDSSLCASWTACQKWRQGPNQPDWDYLEHQYGSAPVSLWECRSDSQEEMTLTEALQKIRSTSQNRHKSSSFTDNDAPLYYIKDWHLALHCDHHNLPPFYTTPDVFRDDWINGYYLNQRDEDFRFVYAGIQGSYTGVHKDVYGSYSWSTNVVGRKRWYFVPPSFARHLRRFPHSRTSEIVPDFRSVDRKRFSDFSIAEPHIVVIEQEEGSTIFVPSGWYHMVVNLSDCISINHNWSNAYNVAIMYAGLKEHARDVEMALEDVKALLVKSNPSSWQAEFITLSQSVLRQDSGWDWLTFWRMIKHHLTQEDVKEAMWFCPERLRPHASVEVQKIREILPPDFQTYTEVKLLPELEQTMDAVAAALV